MKEVNSFSATIGVVAGYGHSNEVTDAAKIVADVWQKKSAEVHESTGIYISAVVSPSLTVYGTNWGCPVGGERTATVSGSANPAFVQDLDAWKQTVLTVVKAVKAELQQSTVVVEFSELNDFVYLTKKIAE